MQPGDSIAGFSLGSAEFAALKTFLKKHAVKYAEQLLATTYVWAAERRVVAYLTLVCGQIETEIEIADLGGARYQYRHYPAVKIARLAVSTEYQGHNLGAELVAFALGRSRDIAGIAGCRFVVVDSKQASIGFYERLGFRMLDTAANRELSQPLMFVDLKRV